MSTPATKRSRKSATTPSLAGDSARTATTLLLAGDSARTPSDSIAGARPHSSRRMSAEDLKEVSGSIAELTRLGRIQPQKSTGAVLAMGGPSAATAQLDAVAEGSDSEMGEAASAVSDGDDGGEAPMETGDEPDEAAIAALTAALAEERPRKLARIRARRVAEKAKLESDWAAAMAQIASLNVQLANAVDAKSASMGRSNDGVPLTPPPATVPSAAAGKLEQRAMRARFSSSHNLSMLESAQKKVEVGARAKAAAMKLEKDAAVSNLENELSAVSMVAPPSAASSSPASSSPEMASLQAMVASLQATVAASAAASRLPQIMMTAPMDLVPIETLTGRKGTAEITTWSYSVQRRLEQIQKWHNTSFVEQWSIVCAFVNSDMAKWYTADVARRALSTAEMVAQGKPDPDLEINTFARLIVAIRRHHDTVFDTEVAMEEYLSKKGVEYHAGELLQDYFNRMDTFRLRLPEQTSEYEFLHNLIYALERHFPEAIRKHKQNNAEHRKRIGVDKVWSVIELRSELLDLHKLYGRAPSAAKADHSSAGASSSAGGRQHNSGQFQPGHKKHHPRQVVQSKQGQKRSAAAAELHTNEQTTDDEDGVALSLNAVTGDGGLQPATSQAMRDAYATDGRCFGCGKQGHDRRECPDKTEESAMHTYAGYVPGAFRGRGGGGGFRGRGGFRGGHRGGARGGGRPATSAPRSNVKARGPKK
jgi:hypothetical protein